MNKLLIIFLFLTGSVFAGTTALDVSENTVVPKTVFTQKDIQTDSSYIQKASFPSNFKKKYKSDDFVYEVKPKEKSAWDRFWERVGRFFSKWESGDGKSAIDYGLIFKIVVILVFLLVIWLIAKSVLNKEGSWIFGKNSDKKIVRYDEIEKNLRLVDFEKLIRETILAGEKRLCIRYYYLWLLKKMSEKEIIEWDVEKTNSDYLYEIKNEKLRTDFSYLSYLYNYIWYGEFDIDETAFEKAKTAFEKTIKSI